MLYGYARVSSTDQSLTVQEDALKAAGCQTVRSEKVTGTTRKGRTELAILLDFIREVNRRPPRHSQGIEGQGSHAQGYRTAHRHQYGSGQVLS